MKNAASMLFASEASRQAVTGASGFDLPPVLRSAPSSSNSTFPINNRSSLFSSFELCRTRWCMARMESLKLLIAHMVVEKVSETGSPSPPLPQGRGSSGIIKMSE